MKFYLLSNEEVQGPYALGEIQARFRQGQIPADAKYSVGEPGNWKPALELKPSRIKGWAWPLAGLLTVSGALAVGGGWWFMTNHRTPSSEAPPPPNVPYDKWEKTSQLYVKIPPTEWEERLGRNLHKTAYQAATNLVAQTLSQPETAVFEPLSKCSVAGVDWRFLVKGRYQAVIKTGELRFYKYRAFLKRGSNEVWTVEYLDKDKLGSAAKEGTPGEHGANE